MEENKVTRWTSKIMWSAIVAQVLTILLLTGVITPTESETLNKIAAAGLQILTLLGIINNPTDPRYL